MIRAGGDGSEGCRVALLGGRGVRGSRNKKIKKNLHNECYYKSLLIEIFLRHIKASFASLTFQTGGCKDFLYCLWGRVGTEETDKWLGDPLLPLKPLTWQQKGERKGKERGKKTAAAISIDMMRISGGSKNRSKLAVSNPAERGAAFD